MRKVVFVYLFFCMLENLASGKTVEGFNRRLPKLMTRYHIKSRLCLYGYKKIRKMKDIGNYPRLTLMLFIRIFLKGIKFVAHTKHIIPD